MTLHGIKMTSKKVIEYLNRILKHYYDAKEDCNCEICNTQENGTYIDGILQAIALLE